MTLRTPASTGLRRASVPALPLPSASLPQVQEGTVRQAAEGHARALIAAGRFTEALDALSPLLGRRTVLSGRLFRREAGDPFRIGSLPGRPETGGEPPKSVGSRRRLALRKASCSLTAWRMRGPRRRQDRFFSWRPGCLASAR